MRHDLDLVKKILIAVEDLPPDPDWTPLYIEGYDDAVVGEHVRILAQAGFIEMKDTSTLAGHEYCPTALTWQGGLFLDQIRSDTAWEKVKGYTKEIGKVSFPILLTRLAEYASTLPWTNTP